MIAIKKRGLKAGDDVAWSVGYSDFYHGFDSNKCPFPENSTDSKSWLIGWNFAKRENDVLHSM